MKNVLPTTKSVYFFFFLALVWLASACNKDDEQAPPPQPTDNILEVIDATEGLDSLGRYIRYLDRLNGNNAIANRLSSNEHTVFAPNNAAFVSLLNMLGLESIQELRRSLLSDVLFYHIVSNTTIRSNQLDSSTVALNDEVINLTKEGDTVRLNTETQPARTVIVSPDLLASNGVVHVVDKVLLPPSVQQLTQYLGSVAGLVGILSGLQETSAVLEAGGLFSTLSNAGSNFVLLAPVDGFLSSVNFTSQQDVNNYINSFSGLHIIETATAPSAFGRTIATRGGQTLYVTQFNGNTYFNGIPSFDLNYTSGNGRLLYLQEPVPQPVSLNAVLQGFEGSGETFNVFKNSLAAANPPVDLGAANTIFVPTDSAFLAAGLVTVVDSTARIAPDVLSNILKTHVIGGVNFLVDIVAQQTIQATALNGTALTINYVQGTNSASLTVADTNAETPDAQVLLIDGFSTNGVVHVIDQLLLP